ncbi:MAG: mechanosensitive ion channel, partial [Paracoccaceae bacterium]|nr:mechanosensitive ion channel [Paracoccaceae bacterium]
MQELMNTDIWNGTTLADVLTLEFLASLAGSVVGALALVLGGFIVAGWARNRVIGLSRRYKRLDITLFSFLGNILRYVILAFTALFVLNTFGIQTTSIVAVIGAAGLAIGLALQGTLSNVAAGVMIILFRPFKNGDFVEVAGQSGTVQEISLNFTELSSVGNVQVIIPNSQVWGNVIVNYSAYDTRRAEWIFGVSYDADLKKAETIIRDTIMSDPRSRT